MIDDRKAKGSKGRARGIPSARLLFAGRILLAAAWILFCVLPSWAGRGDGGGGKASQAACRFDTLPLTPIPSPDASLEDTVLALSVRGCAELSGRKFDRERATGDLARLTGRVEALLGGDREPHRALAAIAQVLFREEKFAYDASGTDADLYLLDRVLERKRGNCLGLTLLYDLIGERLGIPLTGSYLPGHIFVRYESGGVRINAETSREGKELPDAEYRRVFKLSQERPYLRTLDRQALAAILVKTLGASCACGKKDEAALRLYGEAKRLYPELADIYFNTGISLQRTGQKGQALEEYRKCLSLDPGLGIAREKLDRATQAEGAYCDYRSPPTTP